MGIGRCKAAWFWGFVAFSAIDQITFSADDRPVSTVPVSVRAFIETNCFECHTGDRSEGHFDLKELSFDLSNHAVREKWIHAFDRVKAGEMPPEGRQSIESASFMAFEEALGQALNESDIDEVRRFGRGSLRRLNQYEYEQNLRDVLELPDLDIRDVLPMDRESFRFHKAAGVLDISEIQMAAYLEAAEIALRKAIAPSVLPPEPMKFRAVGRSLFAETTTFGNREAMFFAKNGKAIDDSTLAANPQDAEVELALFRSAHWPYYGYPQGFVAVREGAYRVRFSARAVLQNVGLEIVPAKRSVAMTFRIRKPSGPDVSGDVRADGGWIDIVPEKTTYEAVIHIRPGETFEYSLLGLPVPLARNVDGGPPTYRYPPFPSEGQPGVAVQWLEVEGPLVPEAWPPASHHVLFDQLPLSENDGSASLSIGLVSTDPTADSIRLMRRFADRVAREPISDAELEPFLQLIRSRLAQNVKFAEAMLSGYTAFLCSKYFLFLEEPRGERARHDQYAIASRLSHFLTDSRPDPELMSLARQARLRDRAVLEQQVDRLIDSPGFARFVTRFTDDWLSLRQIQRDEADIRLFPEYRFDAYLVESLERETRAYFTAMLRENLPATSVVSSDFVFANDRLAAHYSLQSIDGSMIRKVPLPEGSPYGGFLTQGAIMKVTANGSSTSPVIRGAWIMERLIGSRPPPPPAKVPAVEPDIRGARTIRELLALHTSSDSCRNCHARFDPVGLALENFDVLGHWRVQYRGVEGSETITGIDRAGHDFRYAMGSEIDPSGKLLDGREFQNVHDLRRILAGDSRQLARNLLQQFMIYSTGTLPRFCDRPVIEEILDRCEKDHHRVKDLLIALVTSPLFLGEPGCK